MDTKTLKEKIFDIAFWIVYFFCAFLIVGYLIDSGFLKVVPAKDKIYEILKDALSIGAAFLAPVAAFVLFSDWREQHIRIKQEKLNEDFFLTNKRIIRKLYKLLNESSEKNNLKFYKYKSELDVMITELWDLIFIMGLTQSFSENFLHTGFRIQKKFKDILNETVKTRKMYDNFLDSIDDDENELDETEIFDNFYLFKRFDDCAELSFEAIHDLFEKKILEISDIDGELNKMLPEGLRNQVTHKK